MFNVMCEDYNGVIGVMGTYATASEAKDAVYEMFNLYDSNGVDTWYIERDDADLRRDIYYLAGLLCATLPSKR